MKKNKFTLGLIALTLAGCNSSDEGSEPNAEPNPQQYENIHVTASPNEEFKGKFHVYIGQWFPCSTEYPEFCVEPSQAKPLSEYKRGNGNNKLTQHPDRQELTITADELNQFAKSTGKIPLQPDVFSPGHYTLTDLLVYISHTYEDIQINLDSFSDDIGSHRFTVNYDENNDGVFDAKDGVNNFNNPNWYVSFLYSDGIWKRGPGSAQQEPLYDRLDEFLLRDDMHIRLRPFDSSMTERREQAMKAQVERYLEHGVTTVPKIIVDNRDGSSPVMIEHPIPVKRYQLRQDTLGVSTLTLADALMTANDSGEIDVEFTFWPTLHTKANVGSYAVSAINGKRAEGLKGWAYTSGELENEGDFFWSPVYPTAQMLVDQDATGTGPYAGKCRWLTQSQGGKHNIETAQICIDNWYSQFGGNNIHVMTDITVMKYPREAVNLRWNFDMSTKFEVPQQNSLNDGKWPIYDIDEATAPLEESHFGWKIADCSLCHSIDNIHLNGDSPALPDVVEPYFCASCHGSNGAPKGHGETGRCFWCHSEDVVMTNHGDASTKKLVGDILCQGTTDSGLSLDGLIGPCADVVGKFLATHDQAENSSTYNELVPNLQTLANSDWHTSNQFPDPYSCATCHPKQ